MKTIKTFGILLVFILLALIFTYPMIFNLKTSFYGYHGDTSGTIWYFWWLKKAIWGNHISPLSCPMIGAPVGVDLGSIPQNAMYLYFAPLLLYFFNEIVTYNLMILLSFPLAAIFMYLLAFYITRDRICSFLSGLIYGFCPYIFAHAFGHLTLTHIWWLPLYLLSLIRLCKKQTPVNVTLTAVLFALAAFLDYYYGYIAGVTGLICICFYAWTIASRRRRDPLSIDFKSGLKGLALIILSIFLGGVLTLPFTYSIFVNIFGGASEVVKGALGYEQPVKYLFVYSARPLSYLLPSVYHPVFGGITRAFLGTFLYGESVAEHTLFLGIIPILLTIAAFKRTRKNPDTNLRILKFLLFAGLLFSIFPYIRIGPLLIPLPSYMIYKIAPMFRNPARNGLIVIAAVSVLSAVGLKHVLGSTRRRLAVAALLIALVLFEFINIPPLRTTDISRIPEPYRWLSEQKGQFNICEYPMLAESGTHGAYLFFQRVHGKPLVNGAVEGTDGYDVKKKILNLEDPLTPNILRWLNVKYIVLHPEEMKKSETLEIVGVLPDFSRQRGLRLMRKFDDAEIYEVTARPVEPK